ncbi:putative lipid II flippase FtsW [Propioniciclava coleopterorum]|nr:putative lipid II flippase FtsW [Propioniciclava coleopterorum]
MAILTPSRTTRPASAAPGRKDRAERGLRASASHWLAHPLADVFLVTVPTLILIGLGTLMVWSASTPYGQRQFDNPYYFVLRHGMFLLLALIAGAVTARIRVQAYAGVLSWVILSGTVIALALTFTPLGYGVGGNKNWLNFGGSNTMLRLQPAEFAKLAIVVWGAAVLSTKRKLLGSVKHVLMPFVVFSMGLIGLVVLQKDLGTAIILALLMLGMLWCAGAPLRVISLLVALFGAGTAALVYLEPNRMARILGFLDPTADPTGINHQPIRALYGLATGGWLGVGLGAGRQKWGALSEAHTDYILAVIGEELGLLGTLIVFALFVALAWGGFRIAVRSSSFFGRLAASGITLWLTLQALINILVVLQWAPVLGVPLPFVSYGGSAMLANVMAIGVLVACARDEPGAIAWRRKRAKRKAPSRRFSTVLPGRRPS